MYFFLSNKKKVIELLGLNANESIQKTLLMVFSFSLFFFVVVVDSLICYFRLGDGGEKPMICSQRHLSGHDNHTLQAVIVNVLCLLLCNMWLLS